MTVINTNVGALQARVASLGAQTNMEKAMQRLSSGLRINSAADDAAGLAVATKMESQLRGINMAIRNSNDGISLVQTAESGMAEISNMVIRMRELAVQMNNGIYSDGDRANAQLELKLWLRLTKSPTILLLTVLKCWTVHMLKTFALVTPIQKSLTSKLTA